MSNNYFHYWVDSKKDEEIKKFQECIDSYIYFKKDSLLITNQLIRENRNFQAPKLLKTFLLLFSRDINKLTLAKDTIKSISVDNINNHFHKYLEVAKLWINNDLKNLLKKLDDDNVAVVSHSSFLKQMLYGTIGDDSNQLNHCHPYKIDI